MLIAAFYFAKAYIDDVIMHWSIYLLLMLPVRWFQAPVSINDNRIWIEYVELDNGSEREQISGHQFVSMGNEDGLVPFNTLLLYYPNTKTLRARYIDLDTDDAAMENIEIDVLSRKNKKSGVKCKFGRINIKAD